MKKPIKPLKTPKNPKNPHSGPTPGHPQEGANFASQQGSSNSTNPQGTPNPANPATLQQIASLTQDLQRTRADFENFRKQVEMQKAASEKSTRLQTVFKLLPLLDDFGRAIASYPELAPLQKSLEKTLTSLNLQPIDSSEGTEFNPDLHDAAMVEGEGDKEVIAEVLRPGYYYESEVLRPAMVKVRRTDA